MAYVEAENRTLARAWKHYPIAVAAVVAALRLHLGLVQLLGHNLPPFIIVLPVIMVVSLLCGAYPGLVATFVATLLADYWLMPPIGSFAIRNAADAIALTIFFGMGVFMSMVAERYRRTQKREAALTRELALRESERQFRTLADAIPQLTWMANPDGFIFWYNERWYEYTGTTPEEMEGWGWQSVHNPETLPEVLERWKGSIATGEPFEMVFPLRGADGVFRPFLTRVMPVKDAAGKVIRWFGTNTDIASQKQAEEASKNSFAALSNFVPQLVWMCTPDGLNIYFNQRWVDYTGLTLEESYGRGWNTPFHPDDKQLAWDAWNRAVRSGGQYSIECRLRAADGSYRRFLIRGEPMPDTSGGVLRWLGTCTDIEDLRQESEQRYRNLFNSMDEGFCVIEMMFDADGKPADYRFLEVNPAFEKQTGLHGAVGKRMLELAPDHEAHWFEIYGRIALTGEPAHFMDEAKALNRYYNVHAYRVGEPEMRRVAIVFDDISEYKRAQEALRLSEERLQVAVEVADLGQWNLDLNSHAAFRSLRHDQIFGYDSLLAEWTYEMFLDHVMPEHRAEVDEKFKASAAAGTWDFETRIRRTDGEVRWIWARGRVKMDESGQPARMFGTIMDITERKRAEEALRSSQAKLQGIVGSAMDAIISVDEQQRIVVFNRAAELVFQCAASDAVGSTLDRFIPTSLREVHHEHIRSFGSAGLTARSMNSPGILTAVRSDGEEFPIEATISQVQANGEKIYTVILRDITERKQAEDALRKNEQRWATTLQSIGDAVISTDAVGKIEFMNDVAQDLTGWSLPEAKGRDLTVVFDIVQEVTRVRPESPVAKVIRLGKVVGLANHTALIQRDGTEIPIEDSAAPIRNPKGQIEGVVLVFHDCLEQRKVEATLRNSDRLATTGRLAATIAHEIHNPLDAVGNLLFLIVQDVKDDTILQYASMASGELARVTQMTRQMLAFQREATTPVPVKIGEILESVTALFERKIASAGIRLKQQIDFDGHILVQPGELRQIFANLVGNAIEAMGTRCGTITLRAYESRDRRRGLPGIRVLVADDGPGIPEHVRGKIFDPFFTTKGEGGTGLGLWIASDILRKYDGTMRLRSSTQPQRSGTCFSVFVPFEISSDSPVRS